MTLDEIDQFITDLQQKIHLASQNLLDLQALSTYQRLVGESGFPKLQLIGMSEQQVTPALDALNTLFQYFDLLVNTVDRAVELRKQIPRFLGGEQKIQDIEYLLMGNSIQLPVVQIPLAQRGLLSATETVTAISPTQLLTIMTHAFEVARDAVLAVDTVWCQLEPIIIRSETEIQSLQQLATSLNVAPAPALVTAQQALLDLHDRIERDPLGANTDFEGLIQPLITQAKADLEQWVRQQNQIKETLAIAYDLLNQLRTLHTRSLATYSEAQDKIAETEHPIQSPLADIQLDALSQWLTRLDTKFAEGLVSPLAIGLENWMTRAREAITIETQAIATNYSLLETRRELRGRLDALTAKALARGKIEDPILIDLAQQAKQLLYRRPTPLNQAAALVAQYEKQLNGRVSH